MADAKHWHAGGGKSSVPGLAEDYTYFGRIGPALFFICFGRKTQALLAQIACDIYNLLIQETMIQKGDNVVVYALEPLTNEIRIAQARHVDFARAVFPGDTLRSIYSRLVREPRPLGQEVLIVTAIIEGTRPVKYTFVETAMEARFYTGLRHLANVPPTAIKLEITHAISLKPIPYLDPPSTTAPVSPIRRS